jgi:hypothetical protein
MEQIKLPPLVIILDQDIEQQFTEWKVFITPFLDSEKCHEALIVARKQYDLIRTFIGNQRFWTVDLKLPLFAFHVICFQSL